jgi:hypothetical protein
MRLPDIHKDPFDRILIGQAIVHGMVFRTLGFLAIRENSMVASDQFWGSSSLTPKLPLSAPVRIFFL